MIAWVADHWAQFFAWVVLGITSVIAWVQIWRSKKAYEKERDSRIYAEIERSAAQAKAKKAESDLLAAQKQARELEKLNKDTSNVNNSSLATQLNAASK